MSLFKSKRYLGGVYHKGFLVKPIKDDSYRISNTKLIAFCGNYGGWYKYVPSKGSFGSNRYFKMSTEAVADEYTHAQQSNGFLDYVQFLPPAEPIPPIYHPTKDCGTVEYFIKPTHLHEVSTWSA